MELDRREIMEGTGIAECDQSDFVADLTTDSEEGKEPALDEVIKAFITRLLWARLCRRVDWGSHLSGGR